MLKYCRCSERSVDEVDKNWKLNQKPEETSLEFEAAEKFITFKK